MLAWLIYFNIDHIPWVSFFGLHLSVESKANEITYIASPDVMVNATNYDVLSTVIQLIDKHHWRKTIYGRGTTVQLYFGHDSIEYGGIIVKGPGLMLSIVQHGNSQVFDKYHWLKILDLREICGDTPKNKACTFNNPFKGFTDLFWGLVIYSLVSIAFSTLLLQRSSHGNREETQD